MNLLHQSSIYLKFLSTVHPSHNFANTKYFIIRLLWFRKTLHLESTMMIERTFLNHL